MAKRKVIAKTTGQLATMLDRMDGVGAGFDRTELMRAMDMIIQADVECRVRSGFTFPLAMLSKLSKKKAVKRKAQYKKEQLALKKAAAEAK